MQPHCAETMVLLVPSAPTVWRGAGRLSGVDLCPEEMLGPEVGTLPHTQTQSQTTPAAVARAQTYVAAHLYTAASITLRCTVS